jgi:UDP-glucose 4-epimerase
VKAFEEENGIEIPYIIAPRREGDIAKTTPTLQKRRKSLAGGRSLR